jgi:putative hemolysin
MTARFGRGDIVASWSAEQDRDLFRSSESTMSIVQQTPAPASAPPVRFSYSSPDQPWLQRTLIQGVEVVGGRARLKKLYRSYVDNQDDRETFFDAAIRLLRLRIDHDAEQLHHAPRTGPLLFIANHPYGVLDGIILTWLAAKVRPDVKVLAHSALCQAPGAAKHLLPIDFAPTEAGRETTLQSRLAAMAHLKAGGAVGIFPGGGISTTLHPLTGPAVDLPWAPFTAKLIHAARADVMPLFFAGQNSRLFQLASHLSMTLRLSLIFHETQKRIGSTMRVRVGEPIRYERLAPIRDRALLVENLRRETFALARPGDLPGDVADLHRRIASL